MVDKLKTCFVISPIGEEASQVRQNADDLFDLIIMPALEIYGFNVVRADKISTPSIITNDIVKLVQDSELCVVDLTGQNPNVYYECGRRHENGKPTIQLISKGEKIPFDVAGIRTISYDLSTARFIRDTIVTIREFVTPFEAAGYVVSSSGASLTSIAEALDRIERQITRIKNAENAAISPAGRSDDLLMKGPRGAILDKLKEGNIDEAEQLFGRFVTRLNLGQFVEMGSRLCMAGSKVAKDIMIKNYDLVFSADDADNIKLFIGSIVQYYIVNDLEKSGIEEMKGLFATAVNKFETRPKIFASINWQKSRLHFGAKEPKIAYRFAEQAVEADPDEYESLFSDVERPV